MKKLLTTVAISATLISSAVFADPIKIDTGAYGITDIFTALGASNIPTTSVYTHGGAAGSVTSADDLIGALGLGVTDNGSGTVGQLSPLLGSGSTQGYGDDWVIDFTYSLTGGVSFVDGPTFGGGPLDGTLDGYNAGGSPTPDGIVDAWDSIVPSYTTGVFDFFFRDLNSAVSTQVLRLDLDSFTSSGPNVVINAVPDYSWYTAGSSTLVEGFLIDAQSNTSWYDLATSATPPNMTFRADFNVDPNFVPTCDDADCLTLSRTTDINITGVFSVPEPTSLALLGLGLIGLGLRSRKKLN